MVKMCTNCGVQSRPKTEINGSFIMELIGWLIGLASFFVIPFLVLLPLIYSAWRFTGNRKVCRLCGAENMVPVDSPMGKTILDK